MIVSRIRRVEETFVGHDGRTYQVNLYVCQDVPKNTDPVTLFEVEIKKKCVTQDVYKDYKHKYFTDKEEAANFYASESTLLRHAIKVESL